MDLSGAQRKQPAPTITEYTCKVDYNLSIEEAVKAGKYNWSNENITADNFPALAEEQGQKDLDFALVHYNLPMNSDNAIADMDKPGLRPATVRETLAFAIKYPDLQRQFPILALGQWVDINGIRKVLCLFRNVSDRELYLFSFDYDWGGRYRFLFVYK